MCRMSQSGSVPCPPLRKCMCMYVWQLHRPWRFHKLLREPVNSINSLFTSGAFAGMSESCFYHEGRETLPQEEHNIHSNEQSAFNENRKSIAYEISEQKCLDEFQRAVPRIPCVN